MTEHDPMQDAGSGRSRDERSGSGAREAAWDEVAASFGNLGKQVRKRFERPASESTSEPTAEETPTSREGPGGDSVRRWIDTLDDAFTRLGETVRDPEFRKEAGSSVGRLGEALGVTLREFGDQLQGRFGRSRTDTAPGKDMPDVPPPPRASTPPSSDVPSPPPRASTPPSSDVPPPPPRASTPPSSDVPPPPPAAPSEHDAPAGEAPPDEPPPA